jgi:hypothetical protein
VSTPDALETLTAADLDADPTAAERAVLATDPAFAAAVERVGETAAERIRARRSALIAGLRTDEAALSAAARVRIPWFRQVGFVLACLTSAGAFAVFFSRADLDPDVGIPVAMLLIAASAVCGALSVLPARRSSPPPAQLALGAWVFAALATIAAVFGGYLVFEFRPQLAPWVIVGAAGAAADILLAVAAWWARRGVAPEPRRAGSDGSDWGAELRETVARERAAATADVRRLADEMGPRRRAELERARTSAVAALESRGLHPAVAELPGQGVVARAVDRAAAAVGVRDA